MAARPLHIALVIPSLSAGGAERVLVLLARGLRGLGHRVSVLTLFAGDQDFYPLPEGVDRIALGVGKTTRTAAEKIAANARRLAALRRTLCQLKPDAAVSFMSETNVLVLLATAGLGVPVVVTEHNDPTRRRLKPVWRWLRRVAYCRASRLVSVSAGVDRYFTWLAASKRAVIHNPISLADLAAQAGEPPAAVFLRPRNVIGMGRLELQKGFDLLIEAFARLASRFPDWGLVILGEGSRRADLQSLAASLQIGDRVGLPGTLREPWPTLRRADLFVLSSRYEGFGIALVEAMACGLPVIAADCPSGPREIVRHRADGILVPPEDVEALAAAMGELMADAELRGRLGAEAAKAAERFDLGRVSRTWDELLRQIAGP